MIVFDMDGTLSIVGDRLKYLQQEPKDWDSFYEACDEDEVNEPVAKLYRDLMDENYIIIITGRRESVRDKTHEWLYDNHLYVEYDDIYMRKDGDFRHDTIVKPELIKVEDGKIDMIFEDRTSMVNKWRELGYTCLQVADGDF